jgi:quercetin dioxygenase-like cupin family protein
MSTVIPQLPKGLVGLIDSKPEIALLINLDDYYAKRALPEKGVDSDVVFDAPRSQLMIRTAVKGTRIGTHFHTVADEIVIVTGGSGELLINGVWIPVKRGDLHVCPRGIVHDTRAFTENLQYLSVFTPHLPPGGDINWVE